MENHFRPVLIRLVLIHIPLDRMPQANGIIRPSGHRVDTVTVVEIGGMAVMDRGMVAGMAAADTGQVSVTATDIAVVDMDPVTVDTTPLSRFIRWATLGDLDLVLRNLMP